MSRLETLRAAGLETQVEELHWPATNEVHAFEVQKVDAGAISTRITYQVVDQCRNRQRVDAQPLIVCDHLSHHAAVVELVLYSLQRADRGRESAAG